MQTKTSIQQNQYDIQTLRGKHNGRTAGPLTDHARATLAELCLEPEEVAQMDDDEVLQAWAGFAYAQGVAFVHGGLNRPGF